MPLFTTTAAIQATVRRLAEEHGFSRAGIARLEEHAFRELEGFSNWVDQGYAGEMNYLKRKDEEDRLLRSSPRIPFPWARSVIVCASNYNAAEVKSIDPAPAGTGWISRYAWSGLSPEQQQAPGGRLSPSDYHDVLLARLRQLNQSLQSELGPFESRCYVDTGPLIERVCARYAGIGWIGKNACVIDQKLGSWFFLSVIVTSLELPSDFQAMLAEDRCGSCTRCIDACPTDALLEPRVMDASRCISYLTIEKRGSIPEDLRAPIGRQVFGCDICQDVCPWNRRAPVSTDPGFVTREELVNPALDWLGELDVESFRRFFKKSPLSRTKLAGLLRNVAIAMGNSGDSRYLPRLRDWASGDDLVLRETALWAIAKLEECHSAPEGSTG